MKKKMQKLKKQIKGITLIALVITIIVLLILAAVAINLTIGSNGIFTRAQNSVDIWKKAEIDEQKDMNSAVDEIDKVINGEFLDNGEIDILVVDSVKNMIVIMFKNKNISEELINNAKDQVIKECDTIEEKENIYIQYIGSTLGVKTEDELLNYLFESGETDVLYKSLEEYYEETKTDDKTYEEFLNENVSKMIESGIGIFDITIKSPSNKVDTATYLSVGNSYMASYNSNELGVFEITIRLHGTNIGKKITYNNSEKEYKVSIENNKARLITDVVGQEVNVEITNAYIYVNDEKIDVSDCVQNSASNGIYLDLKDVSDKIEQDLPWEIELVSDNVNAKTIFSEWQLE